MEELEKQIQGFSTSNGSGDLETPENKRMEDKDAVERVSFVEKK
jgi:hypothetical protein